MDVFQKVLNEQGINETVVDYVIVTKNPVERIYEVTTEEGNKYTVHIDLKKAKDEGN